VADDWEPGIGSSQIKRDSLTQEMTAKRAALRERWSGNGLSPMTAFEMAGAVYRDSRADAMSPDCDCCPDCPREVGRDGQVAAYDRRGLLNLVAALLDRLPAPALSPEPGTEGGTSDAL
jgi:hypothetical protein